MRTYLAVFVSVFLAELGDKTQLATVLFATDPTVTKAGIFVAAASALVLSTFIAVVVGAQVGAFLPARPLKLAAGIGFVAVGVWVLVSAFRTT